MVFSPHPRGAAAATAAPRTPAPRLQRVFRKLRWGLFPGADGLGRFAEDRRSLARRSPACVCEQAQRSVHSLVSGKTSARSGSIRTIFAPPVARRFAC